MPHTNRPLYGQDLERAITRVVRKGGRVHVHDKVTNRDGRLLRRHMGSSYSIVIAGTEYLRNRRDFDVIRVEEPPE
jgi:hypothetical protein